ncbi:zinc-ribbon domain containing protein [Clostridium tagluense]|uniref:zinc-ribbon domain containing protein n=1 Tax=Clostridium tagluense TaxID=360422 RepID=UPI001CF32648|nr:zinc-ribbon domain containing protein [Clostridium tagluense]MCB2297058.1 zinc-ribbon domain-containing protein [Clostridium tagluense]
MKIKNIIRNIFRKNENKVFKIEPEKIEKVGTKKQFADKLNREILICKDCGEEFILEDSEKNFYTRTGIPSPKRCLECRKTRKKY